MRVAEDESNILNHYSRHGNRGDFFGGSKAAGKTPVSGEENNVMSEGYEQAGKLTSGQRRFHDICQTMQGLD